MLRQSVATPSFAPAGARGIERSVPRAYARGHILSRLRRCNAGEKYGLAPNTYGVKTRSSCGTRYERQAWRAGRRRVAGVDEVGRGALFGPVLAAAVILDPEDRIRGLQDSKRLSPQQRERLAVEIRHRALTWAVAGVDAAEIDRINILQASRLAMRQAVLGLDPPPDLLLVDALQLDVAIAQIAIIRGDALSVSIAAASILAKVERDALMREWDRRFQIGRASCRERV